MQFLWLFVVLVDAVPVKPYHTLFRSHTHAHTVTSYTASVKHTTHILCKLRTHFINCASLSALSLVHLVWVCVKRRMYPWHVRNAEFWCSVYSCHKAGHTYAERFPKLCWLCFGERYHFIPTPFLLLTHTGWEIIFCIFVGHWIAVHIYSTRHLKKSTCIWYMVNGRCWNRRQIKKIIMEWKRIANSMLANMYLSFIRARNVHSNAFLYELCSLLSTYWYLKTIKHR